MMKTIVQLKIPETNIGCAFKAKRIHYLESYNNIGKPTYADDYITVKINEIVTCTKIETHPYWDGFLAVQFLYNCKLMWLSIEKKEFIDIMAKEFELIA